MTRHGQASGLRPGQLVEVEIEKVVYRGLGLARREGQVVFVPRALPGERLKVRIESVSRGYVRAAVEARLIPGPERRPSPCPYVPRCGGCSYQDVDYRAQLALKEAVLAECLSRAGISWTAPVPLRPSPEVGWRTRATFHLGRQGDELTLGLHEEASHRVVNLGSCLQVSAEMNGAAQALLGWLREEPTLSRRVREAAFAESLDRRQLVVTVEGEIQTSDLPGLARGSGRTPGATGFGALVEGRFHLLHGSPFVHSEVRGRRFRAHGASFFQGNRFLVGDLVDAVVALGARSRVLDLYAGVGLFAACIAERAEEVVAVEGSATAIDDAAANTADLPNVRLHRGDVVAVLATIPQARGETLILDPPRTGAGTGLLSALARREPARIVYVSCDPPTLARDLRTLLPLGFEIESVRALDLFPDTFHLETVVALRRN